MILWGERLGSTPFIESDQWREFLQEIVENFEEEETEELDNLYNDLSELMEHPMDLNRVGREELTRLPFLSDIQIDEILSYREKEKRFLSPWELRSLSSIDEKTLSYLIPFVQVLNDSSWGKRKDSAGWWKHGKHEIQTRFNFTLEKKQGYRFLSQEEKDEKPNSFYRGEPFYHYLKYAYSAEEHLQMGVLMEKDAGEPLLKDTPRGYDFYSIHFLLRNIGLLKTLVLGHYRASFGQGLIVNNDFSFGKSSLAFMGYKRSTGLHRHSSTSENNFLQGIGTTLKISKNVEGTLFLSYRKLDATATDSSFTSIKTDGLHRTQSEEEKFHQVGVKLLGTNLDWKNDWFRVGITALYYNFSKTYLPTPHAYNLDDFREKENYNIGTHYEYRRQRLHLFGESAFSKSGGFATLNGLLFSATSSLDFSLLQRYYSPCYHAYFAKAFGENSKVRDESGVYMSLAWSFWRNWKVSAYADFYRFSTPHYGIDAPSSGYDYQVVLSYTSLNRWETYIRYKHRVRPKNYMYENEHSNSLVDALQDRIKLQALYHINDRTYLKGIFDVSLYKKAPALSYERGFLFALQGGYKFLQERMQVDLYAGYFNASDYAVRMWSGEKSMLYTFYVPSFYGKGFRTALNVKCKLKNHIALYLKFSRVRYIDQNYVGSDLERIAHPYRHDFSLLLKWSF